MWFQQLQRFIKKLKRIGWTVSLYVHDLFYFNVVIKNNIIGYCRLSKQQQKWKEKCLSLSYFEKWKITYEVGISRLSFNKFILIESFTELYFQYSYKLLYTTRQSKMSCNVLSVTCFFVVVGLSSSSSVSLRYCSYRGTRILHGNSIRVDECMICSCEPNEMSNSIYSTVKCDITNCPQLFCDEPISLKGECCEICPERKFWTFRG